MNVRLVAITKPLIAELNTALDFVAYAARVSNPNNQMNTDTAPKLLRYLQQNRHWSPFEMAHAVLEIRTTRDIARQMLRHRSFSFQEFSQRYACVDTPAVIREARLQDTTNRQNSLPCTDADLSQWWEEEQEDLADIVHNTYVNALAQGIAKECARAILPEGMTASTMYMAGTIRSWIHYVQERTAEGTQAEHRRIAEECRRVLIEHMPELEGSFG